MAIEIDLSSHAETQTFQHRTDKVGSGVLFTDIEEHGADKRVCDRELLSEQPRCSVQTFTARRNLCNLFIDQLVYPAAQFFFFFVIKLVDGPVEHEAAAVGAAAVDQQLRIDAVQLIGALRSVARLADESRQPAGTSQINVGVPFFAASASCTGSRNVDHTAENRSACSQAQLRSALFIQRGIFLACCHCRTNLRTIDIRIGSVDVGLDHRILFRDPRVIRLYCHHAGSLVLKEAVAVQKIRCVFVDVRSVFLEPQKSGLVILTSDQIHTASGIDLLRLFFRSAVQPADGIVKNVSIHIYRNDVDRLYAEGQRFDVLRHSTGFLQDPMGHFTDSVPVILRILLHVERLRFVKRVRFFLHCQDLALFADQRRLYTAGPKIICSYTFHDYCYGTAHAGTVPLFLS